MGGLNNQFSPMNKQFSNMNESFSTNKAAYPGGNTNFNMNQGFGNDNIFGSNQKEPNIQNRNSEAGHFDDGNQARDGDNDQFNGKQQNNGRNNHFNSSI